MAAGLRFDSGLKPDHRRQLLAISGVYEGITAEILIEHGGPQRRIRQLMLADFMEAEAAVKQKGRVAAVFDEHLCDFANSV